MARRVLIPVLVVVAMVTRSMTQGVPSLNDVTLQCRNDAGQQAPLDLQNMSQQFVTCAKIDELSAEFRGSDMKEAIESVCSRKTEILKCVNQMYDTVYRCLDGNDEKGLTALKASNCMGANFMCDHVDDLVAIIKTPTEMMCLPSLGQRLQTCAIQQSGITNLNTANPDDVQKVLKIVTSLNQTCRTLAGIQKCALTETTHCRKDSRIMQFAESLLKKVVNDGLCSNEIANDNICSSSPSTFMTESPIFLIVNILTLITFRNYLF